MKLLVILLVVTALGCQIAPVGTEFPTLHVVGIEKGKVRCQLNSPAEGIWMVRGIPSPLSEPVPDTEYLVEGEWVVENLDWCRHRVEWFRLGRESEYCFTITADTSLPVRIALDAQRLIVHENKDTGEMGILERQAIRLIAEPQGQ